MRLPILLLAIFSVWLSFSSCQSTTPASEQSAQVELLAPENFIQEFHAEENALLIDCRTPREVAGGKIDGAVNIDFQSPGFAEKASEIDRATPIYIYCQMGGRSAAAAEKLKTLGFKEVHDMKGGYSKFSRK